MSWEEYMHVVIIFLFVCLLVNFSVKAHSGEIPNKVNLFQNIYPGYGPEM